jgi:hypothetical protein
MTEKERLDRTAHIAAGLTTICGIVGLVTGVRAVSVVAVGFAVAWIAARILHGFATLREIERGDKPDGEA